MQWNHLRESLAVIEGSKENSYEKFYAMINGSGSHTTCPWCSESYWKADANDESKPGSCVGTFPPRLITYILF